MLSWFVLKVQHHPLHKSFLSVETSGGQQPTLRFTSASASEPALLALSPVAASGPECYLYLMKGGADPGPRRLVIHGEKGLVVFPSPGSTADDATRDLVVEVEVADDQGVPSFSTAIFASLFGKGGLPASIALWRDPPAL